MECSELDTRVLTTIACWACVPAVSRAAPSASKNAAVRGEVVDVELLDSLIGPRRESAGPDLQQARAVAA